MKAYLFPGQGSQFATMGADQFERYPQLVSSADEILGYSISHLCAQNPDNLLNDTAYTQPALFVVNHLMYLDRLADGDAEPDFLAGHSLGEYNAIVAAGALSFEDALRLVKRRGELMSRVTDGGMLAILGITKEVIEEQLVEFGLTTIDVANQNAPSQTILSGRKTDLAIAERRFAEVPNCRSIPLNVSGPFHSRYMEQARADFEDALAGTDFAPMAIPVISNYTARPYREGQAAELLNKQIVNVVRWVDTMRYLMAKGVDDFTQVGPGNVINGLTRKILAEAQPLSQAELDAEDEADQGAEPASVGASIEPTHAPQPQTSTEKRWAAQNLGSAQFKQSFGLRYAYMAGGMYKAISSVAVVVAMAKAGMLGVYGTGGVALDEVREALASIRDQLRNGETFAVNLVSSPSLPEREERFIDLLLDQDVRLVEASAFMSASAALVRYRASGLARRPDGSIERRHRIIAKLSHPDVAQVFAQAPQPRVVEQLVTSGAITAEQGELALQVPLADAITIEGNSGGHTDGGILEVLFPSIRALVRQLERQQFGTESIFVGAAGGIGAPESVAVAFLLGADYIVTGSINQCTVEAGTSDAVKDLLATADVHDTKLSATGDMFELGSKIQVLRKGLFFPSRANKLYELYRQYESLEAIPATTLAQLEDKYFKRPLAVVEEEVLRYVSPEARKRIEDSPQARMVAVFKWYFMMSTQAALTGDPDWRLDRQIQCGPSLGAFNRWVQGTDLQRWQDRHVDEIALRLLAAGSDYLTEWFEGPSVQDRAPAHEPEPRIEPSTMKGAFA